MLIESREGNEVEQMPTKDDKNRPTETEKELGEDSSQSQFRPSEYRVPNSTPYGLDG